MASKMVSYQLSKGSKVCPSCKEDSWKSAKMIIMEGTTRTEGTLSGTMTDPGASSFKGMLLSDRWFSWDQKLNLDIGLTTTSGLVEEVKRLMVIEGAKYKVPSAPLKPPVPTPPSDPEKTGVYFNMTPPVRPKYPEGANVPIKPKAIDHPPKFKPWYMHFVNLIIGDVIMSLALGILMVMINPSMAESIISVVTKIEGEVFNILKTSAYIFTRFGPEAYNVIFIALLFLPIFILYSFFSSFVGNKKLKNKYEKNQKMYNDECNKSYSKKKSYEQKLYQYKLECERVDQRKIKKEEAKKYYKDNMISYKKKLNEYNNDYNETLKEFKNKKNNVINYREALWEKSRICMRCGTAYIGE